MTAGKVSGPIRPRAFRTIRWLLIYHRGMTWSIVARDASGAFGVAVASRFFAVGALCPHARSSVGAVSTQALVNPHYGPEALGLLSKSVAPPDAIGRLTGKDDGREHRQLHMVDSQGRI